MTFKHLLIISTLLLAEQALGSLSAVPSPNTNGNYTVSWTPHGNTDWYELKEQADGGGWVTYTLAPTMTSKSFSGRSDGIYAYKLNHCEDFGHPGEFQCYDTGYGIEYVVVESDPWPSPDSLEVQLDYTYQTKIGHIDSDGRTDIFFERITASPLANGTLDKIILRQNTDGSFTPSVPSATQLAAVATWQTTAIDLRVDDIDLDGYVDVFLRNVATVIPGALDQIVYASGKVLLPFPKSSKALDATFRNFLTEFRAWAASPSYFIDNAVWVPGTSGYYDWEWYCYFEQQQWDCEWIPVWVPGEPGYWSFDHFNQDAYELSETLGGSTYDLSLIAGTPKASKVAELFEKIFNAEVLAGVLTGGGVVPWEIEVGMGGADDRGLVLVFQIFDTSEQVALPGEWRNLSVGEKSLLTTNGLNVPGVNTVRVYNKRYTLLNLITAGFAGNQVVAPNGNIYIPTPNQAFSPAGLPWSNDYSQETYWNESIFLHELFHVFQHNTQNLNARLMWKWRRENPDYIYNIVSGKLFEDYGMEQQAMMIMDRYYHQQTGSWTGYGGSVTLEQLNSVIPY